MLDDKLILDLKSSIEELKRFLSLTNDKNRKNSSIINKKANILSTIVNNFYQILSYLFLSGQKYWDFISKHVNGPVTTFCQIYENSADENEIEDFEKKGKNWILINILENSFLEYMKLIIKYIELNNEENIKNDLSTYKKDILFILEELNNLKFNNNIINEDHQNYLKHIKNNGQMNKTSYKSFSIEPIINNETSGFNNEEEEDLLDFIKLDIEKYIPKDGKGFKKENKPEEFEFKKFADLIPCITENFYNFAPKVKSEIKIREEEINSNIILDSVNNEEFQFKDMRRNSGLLLNTDVQFTNLPSDELYDVQRNNYAKNDLFKYNKKEKKMSNSHLLYINLFYKKEKYYKFYKKTTHEKNITLKMQNYQCFICLKKFTYILGFPIEPVYWCSYYTRYVCKNCISNDFSIIPQLIIKEWCFEKFPISKKAKALIQSWYDKPIIYLEKKNKDELFTHIPNSALRLKKDIRNIFDYMKCEDPFDFLDRTIPDCKYIVLKEYIFSLRDLNDIYNKTFTNKLKKIKEIFVKHITEECLQCKYDGHICNFCRSEEKIYFYNSEKVKYLKKYNYCYHKDCYDQNLAHDDYISLISS